MAMKEKKKTKSKRAKENQQSEAAVEQPEIVEKDTPKEGEENAAEELAVQIDEAAVLKDRLLRLQADFENFRKRTARERADIYKRANEGLMEELLPVIDHMALALQAAKTGDDVDAFVEGFRLIQSQLCEALRKFGLEAVDAVGKPFDPNLHEAIAHQPSDEFEENVVIHQTRGGFTLGGRLLRAAQVVVSSGPVNTDPESSEVPDEASADAAEEKNDESEQSGEEA